MNKGAQRRPLSSAWNLCGPRDLLDSSRGFLCLSFSSVSSSKFGLVSPRSWIAPYWLVVLRFFLVVLTPICRNRFSWSLVSRRGSWVMFIWKIPRRICSVERYIFSWNGYFNRICQYKSEDVSWELSDLKMGHFQAGNNILRFVKNLWEWWRKILIHCRGPTGKPKHFNDTRAHPRTHKRAGHSMIWAPTLGVLEGENKKP